MVYSNAREAIRENFGATVTIGAALLIVIRIGAVGGFDQASIGAILTEVGFANVLIGSLSTAMGPISTVVLLSLAYVYILLGRGRRPIWLVATIAATTLVVGWTVPVAGLAFAVVCFAVTAAVLAPGRRRRRRKLLAVPPGEARERVRQEDLERSEPRMRLAVAALSAIIVFQVIFTAPWFPTEVISIDGEEHVGYVLRADDSSTVLLLAGSRKVEYFQSSLSDRYLCVSRKFLFGLPPSLGREPVLPHPDPNYPACPTIDDPDGWNWLGIDF